MDTYTIQSYFKSLCKTYCNALNESKRLRARINKCTEVVESINLEIEESWWDKELRDLTDNIYRTMYLIKEEKIKIIISSKEEIKVLIYAFSEVFEISNYKIINDAPEIIKILEGDQMCDAFFRAYSSNDDDMMRVLKKIYLE